jgi:hypothetical protein
MESSGGLISGYSTPKVVLTVFPVFPPGARGDLQPVAARQQLASTEATLTRTSRRPRTILPPIVACAAGPSALKMDRLTGSVERSFGSGWP